MARESTGELRFFAGMWSTRIRVFGKRVPFDLPTCKTKDEAKARSAVLAEAAKRMRAVSSNPRQAKEALDLIAAASARSLKTAKLVAEELIGGEIPSERDANAKTFSEIGKWWTSGGARRDYPRQVKPISPGHASGCAKRLEAVVYPVLGDRPVAEITRAECDAVLRQLPRNAKAKDGILSDSTIRQYALLMTRVLGLAELAGHVDRSPLPRGWAGAPSAEKRFPIMYPAEDRAFLSDRSVPLWARVFFGYLHREGSRRGEAVALQRRDVDAAHGTVNLDENKTNHPRFWKLSPGVAEALEAWFAHRGDVKPEDRAFADDNGATIDVDHMAEVLRRWMQSAGLSRADLYSTGPLKGQFGTHCFRRSMVTRNLALGRNEDEVRRRTGHKSDQLLRYRQGAKAFAELDLGDVDPLVLCIPELSPIPGIAAALRKASTQSKTEPAWPLPTVSDCPVIAPQMVGAAGFEPTTLRPPV